MGVTYNATSYLLSRKPLEQGPIGMGRPQLHDFMSMVCETDATTATAC
jgi:hypothetical protein